MRARKDLSEVVWVAVADCKPNSYNPNVMSAETYQMLLEDVKENGVETLDPIHLRVLEGEIPYEIVDGEHRWRTVKDNGYEKLKAIIHKMTLVDAKVFNYRKNKERGTLDPFKEAELFCAEWKKGDGDLTQREIAERYGVSQSQIAQRLKLLNINEDVKEIITRVINPDFLTPSHLEVIALVNDPERQSWLAEKVVNEKLSVLQTSRVKADLTRPDFPLERREYPPADIEEPFHCPCGRQYKIYWKDKMVLPHGDQDQRS